MGNKKSKNLEHISEPKTYLLTIPRDLQGELLKYIYTPRKATIDNMHSSLYDEFYIINSDKIYKKYTKLEVIQYPQIIPEIRFDKRICIPIHWIKNAGVDCFIEDAESKGTIYSVHDDHDHRERFIQSSTYYDKGRILYVTYDICDLPYFQNYFRILFRRYDTPTKYHYG